MPRRTNLFQTVVGVLHAHMAKGATVEESAILSEPRSGDEREVDVVIRSTVAGYDVVVGVEAVARSRKADKPWVEAMWAKHQHLETSHLVLVAEKGFSEPARRFCDDKGISHFSPEDLGDGDPSFQVVNTVRSLWPKAITLSPERANAVVHKPDGERVRVTDLASDTNLYFEDGTEVGPLLAAFRATYDANFLKIVEMIDLAGIKEDSDQAFILQFGPPNWAVTINGEKRPLFLRYENAEAPQLHKIESAQVIGRAVIRVSEVPLEHRRLGDLTYAYGQGTLGDQDALVVVSENNDGGIATVRVGDSMTASGRLPVDAHD